MPLPERICIKMVLLGNSSVGKSALAKRFVDNEFSGEFVSTLGVDFLKKTVVAKDERRVNLIVLDMAGQARFKSVIYQYFRGCSGAIVAFERNDVESFHAVRDWTTAARTYAADLPIVLVETKTDLCPDTENAWVGQKQIDALIELLGCPLFRTSSKTGENVEAAFRCLVELMLKNLDEGGEATDAVRLLDIEKRIELSLPPLPTQQQHCCEIL